ncbi:MAG: ZIP family metal transporter [Candidatus Aenigmarchaeota archaeon]|nr:ZIP family metal transporter [Candidatus Aenigmarchaeota archaeon]
MIDAWLYSLVSVFLISLISFVGVATVLFKQKKLDRIVLYLVSFSVGGLLGDCFIHILPEAMEMTEGLMLGLYILSGILVSFAIEKFIHWRHCHIPTSRNHPHPFAFMNLIGDGVHNFIDGMIIGASYLTSFSLGFATTLAVMLHEIPQEFGDFGVLLHGGFERRRALLMNFVTALTAVLGTVTSLLLFSFVDGLTAFLLPFTIGSFIYIASSDLIPELHKETNPKKSLLEMVMIVAGILFMLLILLIE